MTIRRKAAAPGSSSGLRLALTVMSRLEQALAAQQDFLVEAALDDATRTRAEHIVHNLAPCLAVQEEVVKHCQARVRQHRRAYRQEEPLPPAGASSDHPAPTGPASDAVEAMDAAIEGHRGKRR